MSTAPATAQARPNPPRPPATVAKPSKRERRIEIAHKGTAAAYRFYNGSGTLSVDFSALSAAVQAKLLQTGADRYLTSSSPTFAELQKRAAALVDGSYAKPAAPKLPDPLAEALANVSKARGQGILPADRFAQLCDVAYWQAHCFGPKGMTKEQRAALRAADHEVKAEIERIKAARAKAKAAPGEAVGVDLSKLA